MTPVLAACVMAVGYFLGAALGPAKGGDYMPYAKAIVGLAVPLLTALLVGFSTGSFDVEEIAALAGAFVTGAVVFLVPNQKTRQR